MKLLSIGNDSKTVKGEKFGVLTAICYMAPAEISGVNLCKFSTPECRLACLYSAGRGAFTNVQTARINRAKLWNSNPGAFLELLENEIRDLLKLANKKGMAPAIRLNGTTDILWENFGIIQKYSEIQFYDYTKYPSALRQELPVNYHLTYSFTGAPISHTFSDQWRARGVNTAMVFRPKLPAQWFNQIPVIDGDLSDLRFTDPTNVIVGLKAKGAARKGISSFVTDIEAPARQLAELPLVKVDPFLVENIFPESFEDYKESLTDVR
jgi:hypothetical protein